MGESFRERLSRAVPAWVDEGIIEEEQGQAILERHEAGGPDRSTDRDWASSLLYATAGILLGAAALALVLVGIDPEEPLGWLLAAGGLLAGTGLVLDRVLPGRRLLGEAVLGASLVPLAVASGDGSGDWLLLSAAAGLGVPAAYLVWKREQAFLPTLSVVGFAVAAFISSWSIANEAGWSDGTASVLAATLVLVLLAGVVLVDRVLRAEDAVVPAALATTALAIGLVPFLLEGMELQESETVELALGGLMLIVFFLGLALKHRGMVIGASTAVALDAIVFAFDVGGVWLGVGTLLGLAAVLVWQAEALRGWFAEEISG